MIVGIILLCSNMHTTMCTVSDAYAVLVNPTRYTNALTCQFDTMNYAINNLTIKPSDVVRVICKAEKGEVHEDQTTKQS